MKAIAYCDGRGNAGTGACATVIHYFDTPKWHEEEFSKRLGSVTNNIAEYEAVILAIEKALEAGVTDLTINSDSQLIVNQTLGKYVVKFPHLKELRDKIWELGNSFEKITIQWVPREQTKRPDKLCRDIDKPRAARPRPKSL